MTDTQNEKRSIQSVLSKFAGLSIKKNPLFGAVIPMVPTASAAIVRMQELRAVIANANQSPETIVSGLTPEDVAALATTKPEVVDRFERIHKLRAQLEKETAELANIVSPPMNDDVKAKLTGEFAERKAEVQAFAGIIHLVKDADLSADMDFVLESMPSLRGTGRGITTERKAEDISAEIRAWVHDNATGNVKVAGMQFGNDGRDYGLQENGEKVYLSSRGRIPDAFFRAYREFKGGSSRA